MRRSATLAIATAGLGLLLLQTGCRSGAAGASLLSLFGLSEKPVVVALLAEPGVLDPFTPHETLRKAMSKEIGRPVRLDLSLAVQLEPNLKLGFYDFAVLTPACYVEMKDREQFEVMALPADEEGQLAREAVLVVAADSKINSVDELRGKTVAFGPRGDARTHHAGLALLRDHGLKKTDLSLSVLPIPGSLKHFAKMRDIAQSVINASSDAGFVDKVAFDAFPESSDEEGEPARDKLRVIGRTMSVPDKLVICSPKADPAIAQKVADFLLTADRKHPQALRPLLLSAYREPTEEVLVSFEQLVQPAKLAPDESPPDNPD